MNKYLFILLFISVSLKAQIPSFEWAIKGETDGGTAFTERIAHDNNGNLYASGVFTTNLTFGTTTLVNFPGIFTDIYLCKFDTMGNISWAVRAGGPNFDVVRSIECDKDGNIYLTGRFADYAIFGTHTIISNGADDYFLAKYDSFGNCIWVKSGGGNYSETGLSLLIDNDGFVYSYGSFQDSAVFDNDTLITTHSLGYFLIKYDSLGNQLWSNYIMSQNGLGSPTNMVMGSYGITIAGSLYNTLFANNIPVITTNNNADIYIIQFDSLGNYLSSVKNTNGSGVEFAEQLTIDNSDNLYLTGWFTSNTYFDNMALINSGGNDLFVAKLTPIGQAIWVKKASSPDNNEGKSISVDMNGNVFVSGIINGLVNFDQIQINAPIGNSMNDIFIAKFDSLGNINWVKHVGSSNSFDFARNIMIVNDNLYLHGRYEHTINFDNYTLNNNDQHYDVFLSKLSNVTTDLHEYYDASIFSIYPNPVKETLNIAINSDQEFIIQLIDLMGRSILQERINGFLSLQLKNYPSGLYLIKILDKKKLDILFQERIVIMK